MNKVGFRTVGIRAGCFMMTLKKHRNKTGRNEQERRRQRGGLCSFISSHRIALCPVYKVGFISQESSGSSRNMTTFRIEPRYGNYDRATITVFEAPLRF